MNATERARFVAASERAKLAPTERLVLLALAMHRDRRTGACFPSIDTVARLVGLAPRGVQRSIRKLEEAGLVVVEKRSIGGRQRSNNYQLHGL